MPEHLKQQDFPIDPKKHGLDVQMTAKTIFIFLFVGVRI